jgi:hypothetical protein
MNINEILTTAALVLLGIETLRFIIAGFGIVKRGTRGSRWIYGSYDEDIAKSVLIELGIDIQEIRGYLSKRNLPKGFQPINKLIMVVSNAIQYFDTPMRFGQETTQYYINTMDIVHTNEAREILAKSINYLVGQHCRIYPDIFIVPKEGNVYLAFEIEKHNPNCIIVFVKPEESPSFLIGPTVDTVSVNFEGIQKVFERAKMNPSRNYTSVAIDCNASGGKSIRYAIKKYNAIAASGIKTILPANEAFVLFKPDYSKDKTQDLDTKMTAEGIRIHRYFDLDEETKKILYALKVKYAKVDCYIKKHDDEINDFVNRLATKGFIKEIMR